MWLTSRRASGCKNAAPILFMKLLERECYEGKVQRYLKTNYKPMMMIHSRVQDITLYTLSDSTLLCSLNLMVSMNWTNEEMLDVVVVVVCHDQVRRQVSQGFRCRGS